MPIVLDYTPDGTIVNGYFYSHVLPAAIEAGVWQEVIPGAIYARMTHVAAPAMPAPALLDAVGGMQTGGSFVVPQRRAFDDGDAASGPQGKAVDEQGAVVEVGGSSARSPIGRFQVANEKYKQPTAQLPPQNSNRSRAPSPPAARSPKRRRLDGDPSLDLALPIAVNIEESSGIASVANTAIPKKSSIRKASQIPHVGNIFPHRRALLVRSDKPYICALCGTAFPHPKDVESHFNGHPDIPGRGCWQKHGSKAGVPWNEHPSCKIAERDVNFARCREGWVILDQESWDRVEAAAEEGRKFKRKNGGQEGGAVRLGVRNWEAAAKPVEQSRVERQEPPKRKVVRAGDESETDVGGRRK